MKESYDQIQLLTDYYFLSNTAGEKIWGKDPRDVRNQRTGSHYDVKGKTGSNLGIFIKIKKLPTCPKIPKTWRR